jgi:hypothetical protein
MKLFSKLLVSGLLVSVSIFVHAEELIVGKENLNKNISIIFEAAPKDTLYNNAREVLPEEKTDIHIEALVNWNDNIEISGQIPNSFIPYLVITSEIINENTNEKSVTQLMPHINLSDGFHYAENIKLPGLRTHKYTVKFIISIDEKNITYHHDWKKLYSYPLFDKKVFSYTNQDFKEVSEAVRK